MTPLPDDVLFVPLGLMKYPFWKCIIPGWLGKNFTTLLYMFYPVLIAILTNLTDPSENGSMAGNVVSETIIFAISITVILFLMMYDWNKMVPKMEEKQQKKLHKKEQKKRKKQEK
ncbi:MAG: hypothetical protein GY870_06300 [archaeon]|nr:hypothetical protein [archaeon]